MERRAPFARRLRSSLRTDPEVLHNHLLSSGPHSMSAGYGANTVRGRSARRNKMDRKPSDGLDRNNLEQPAIVSNGSTEESDSEIVTVDSGSFSLNEGSSMESCCKPVYRCAVQCESEVELSHRLKFQCSVVILKKKRKPNRKRLQTDLTESSAGLDKDTALEMPTAGTTDVLSGDPVRSDEKNSKKLKEDGDEHLPLVKRAWVRMGRSAPEGEVLDNEVLNDVKSPGASDKSLEQGHDGDGSFLQNSLCIKSDSYDSSPSKKCSSKRPHFWEISVNSLLVRWMVNLHYLHPNGSIVPWKPCQLMLQMMTNKIWMDFVEQRHLSMGIVQVPRRFAVSCLEVLNLRITPTGVEWEVQLVLYRKIFTIMASTKVLAAQEGLEHLSEVPALSAPSACDDSLAKVSC